MNTHDAALTLCCFVMGAGMAFWFFYELAGAL